MEHEGQFMSKMHHSEMGRRGGGERQMCSERKKVLGTEQYHSPTGCHYSL